MNDTELEATVRAALYSVAPELEGETLDPDRRYRDQFEFDSMDFQRYVIELHERTGLGIAEHDYPQLETLAGAVAYLRTARAAH
jgi:acyl carrier protein